MSDLYDPIDVLEDERESDQDPDWTPTTASHETEEGSGDEDENDREYRTDQAGLRPELQTPQPKNELKTSPSEVKLEPDEHGEGNFGFYDFVLSLRPVLALCTFRGRCSKAVDLLVDPTQCGPLRLGSNAGVGRDQEIRMDRPVALRNQP